jgi:hypothetical protein
VCPNCGTEQDIHPAIPVKGQVCLHCGEPFGETAIAERPLQSEVRRTVDDDERIEPDRPRTRATVRGKVLAAGIIWIVFGCLSIAGALIQMMLVFVGQADPRPGPGGALGAFAVRALSSCGILCGALFGAVFIHVGFQSIRGTAKDVLGNGIGSIIFGVLYTAIALILPLQAEDLSLLVVAFLSFLALALYLAGVLALVARSEYKAFRQTSQPLRRRHR